MAQIFIKQIERRVIEIKRNKHEFAFLRTSRKSLEQLPGECIKESMKEWGAIVHGH